MEQGVKLLPIARAQGKEFLVDVDKREFRNFDDKDDIIRMHSKAGRQILNEIQGQVWNHMGFSTGRQKGRDHDAW